VEENLNHSTNKSNESRKELSAIAEEAYIFGYSVVIADVAREAISRNLEGGFVHYSLPDATNTDITSPNVDALHSLAFMNLSEEPMLLSVPDMGERYYLLVLLDAWTEMFASLGTRTTGNGEGHYAIVGPTWQGVLPEGVRELRAPTNLVATAARVAFRDKADHDIAHRARQLFSLKPLSAWGKPSTPALQRSYDHGSTVAPALQVERMEADTFFARLAQLMRSNPPRIDDAPLLSRVRKFGLEVGNNFDLSKLDTTRTIAGQTGFVTGRDKVREASRHPKVVAANGWEYPTPLGTYGTDYLQRASIAATGLGAPIPEDCILIRCRVDADGQRLRGLNPYVLHFPAGKTPPVTAFWSLSLYDSRYFFVANQIDRYALRSSDQLRYNADGSLDLYLQHEWPGDEREANWLPAPWEDFNVALRLYWGKNEALARTWQPPVIQRMERVEHNISKSGKRG
jgi:hypothetical protein